MKRWRNIQRAEHYKRKLKRQLEEARPFTKDEQPHFNQHITIQQYYKGEFDYDPAN